MSEVILKQIGKTYPNGHTAVASLDLEIAAGEFIVLVGPSGCGKSTLLRMVAGLESISTGELLIQDERVNDKEPAQRDIAMVFQNYALYPHMSVYDNMAYGLKNRGIAKAQITEQVQAVAQMLELETLLERKPKQLSGGQRQRVAMGRAMVRDPKVFLFDEPLSNLDAKLRVQMRVEIRALQRKLGTTTLYVTHDQVEAMTLADRLVVLNQGHVEQIGTPMEVYERPASTFVAQFIGSPAMNLIPSEVIDGKPALDVDIPMACPHLLASSVLLGVRPEHVDIVPVTETPLHLQVLAIEALGAETLLHGTLEGWGDTAPTFVVRLAGQHQPALGERIGLRVSPEAWHVFDGDTQKRITQCN